MKLASWLDGEASKLKTELAKIEERERNDRHPTLSSMPTTSESAKLRRRIEQLLLQLTDAKRWLHECRRTPRRKWVLDPYQARWLYAYEADPMVADFAATLKRG